MGDTISGRIVEAPDGNLYRISDDARVQNVETFAGAGTKTPLHDGVAEGLSARYGGAVGDWQKRKAVVYVDVGGEEVKAEVHWFQNGSDKHRFKIKRYL